MDSQNTNKTKYVSGILAAFQGLLGIVTTASSYSRLELDD